RRGPPHHRPTSGSRPGIPAGRRGEGRSRYLIQKVPRVPAAEGRGLPAPAGGEGARRSALVEGPADPVVPAQDVDGPLEVLVLVRRVPPGERLRVLTPRVVDEKQVGEEGGEALPVRHVHLHSAADLARVLLEGRGEEDGPKA